MNQQPTLFPLPKPDFYTTPGTELRWGTLTEWIEAYLRLVARRDSDAYRAIQAHIATLSRHIIEAETGLNSLHNARQIIIQNKPPRGRRADHPTTLLEMWLNNHITRLAGHS